MVGKGVALFFRCHVLIRNILWVSLLSCATSTGPVPDKELLLGDWYNYDGQMRLTLEESKYSRSEKYGRDDFSVKERGYWRHGATLLFTRVYWYQGAWWEEDREVGYRVTDTDLWLDDEVWYRVPP